MKIELDLRDYWWIWARLCNNREVKNACCVGVAIVILNKLHCVRFREILHRQRRAMAGERLLLTHFLFLPVQLVGCIPTSGCVWGAGFETTTSQFFLLLLGSRATQAVHSHWGGRHLHATLTPAHLGCCWKPNTAPLIFKQSWHDNTLCSSSPTFVLVSFECLCTFSPIIVSLWFPCPVNHKLTGLDTPLSSFHIPISALFLLFCHLFPRALEQKVLLLWMAWHHLAHFVSFPFYVDSFGKKFSVRCFIYLSIYFHFWVLWKSIGLASFQTVACCSFWLYFEGRVGWWFSYEPYSLV